MKTSEKIMNVILYGDPRGFGYTKTGKEIFMEELEQHDCHASPMDGCEGCELIQEANRLCQPTINTND